MTRYKSCIFFSLLICAIALWATPVSAQEIKPVPEGPSVSAPENQGVNTETVQETTPSDPGAVQEKTSEKPEDPALKNEQEAGAQEQGETEANQAAEKNAGSADTPQTPAPEKAVTPVPAAAPVVPAGGEKGSEAVQETLPSDNEEIKERTENGKKIYSIEEKPKPLEQKKPASGEPSPVKGTSGESETPFSNSGMYIGFGMLMPIGSYADRYDSTTILSAHYSMYQFNWYGFSPEIHLRYYELKSRSRDGIVNSTMTQTQFSLGAVRRWPFRLPESLRGYSFLKKQGVLYARVTEGLTYIEFDSDNTLEPVTDTVNTIEFTGGFLYPVCDNFEMGIDFSYRRVFTAGDDLECAGIMLVAGVRI